MTKAEMALISVEALAERPDPNVRFCLARLGRKANIRNGLQCRPICLRLRLGVVVFSGGSPDWMVGQGLLKDLSRKCQIPNLGFDMG